MICLSFVMIEEYISLTQGCSWLLLHIISFSTKFLFIHYTYIMGHLYWSERLVSEIVHVLLMILFKEILWEERVWSKFGLGLAWNGFQYLKVSLHWWEMQCECSVLEKILLIHMLLKKSFRFILPQSHNRGFIIFYYFIKFQTQWDSDQ